MADSTYAEAPTVFKAQSFDGVPTEELVNSLDWLLRCQIKDQTKATMMVAQRVFDAIVERIG